MARHKIEMQLRLGLDTPLHVGTGYGMANYLDARTQTDHENYPYIPGSSLKGRLRYYLRRLLSSWNGPADVSAPIENLFGAKDQVGSLFFGNLRLDSEWRNLIARLRQDGTGGNTAAERIQTQRRTNVMLSRLRGVAMERRLFTVETVPPPLAFEGRIRGYLPDCDRTLTINDQTYPRDLALLIAACSALTHLGGRKSRGLGRCHLNIIEDGLQVNDSGVDPQKLLEALS